MAFTNFKPQLSQPNCRIEDFKLLSFKKFGNVINVNVDYERCTLEDALNFKRFLERFILMNESKKVIYSLNNCNFIDSTFLGVIISTLKKIKKNDGQLKLVIKEKLSTAVFVLTDIHRIVDVYPTLEKALSSFES